jgi:ankyrin repeat protein
MGATALTLAARNGHTEMIIKLRSMGIISTPQINRELIVSPLAAAVMFDQRDAVKV